MIIFVGTYTKQTNSEGIYTLKFYEDEGTLGVLHTTQTENPSFLAVKNDMLYAVNEAGDSAGYTRFSINEDLSLGEKQRLQQEGASSCHIDTSNNGLYIANYSSGDILCYLLASNKTICNAGSCSIDGLDRFSKKIHYTGSGPNEKRQKESHAHSVNVSPNKKHLIVADLGTDLLMIYDILEDGTIKENETNATVHVGAGEGPRHLCYHPTLNKIYVVTELLNNVIVLNYEPTTGKVEKEDVFSILPEGLGVNSISAEVFLSYDAKFLYASNRGWDGIAAFNVNDNGDISPVGYYEGFGKTPRSFLVSKDDNYFVIAYQDSDLIVVVKRNPITGEMGEVVASLKIPAPVCVIEL